MKELLLQNEAQLTSLAFFWIFILAAALEHYRPKREIEPQPYRRWLANAGLWGINAVCTWLLIPVAGTGLAIICGQQGWGLFNNLAAPAWLTILISLLALDFSRYLQHVVLHRVPVLWRFHRSHHTDISVDLSTAWRFHPFEMIYTTATFFVTILLFGIPAYVIVMNTIIMHFTGFFTHANIALPAPADRLLRGVFITPDVHRVHHSSDSREMTSNYGNLLSWWDRMFGTYVAQPRKGHSGMQLGLAEYQDAKYGTLPWMLWMPFAPLTRPAAEQQKLSG
jgi:sterol desaturase/sphingolipid hydroxylase (fatty acid hydroxylase superfamily)